MAVILDEEAFNFEVQNLPGKYESKRGRYKCEGASALPGEISKTPITKGNYHREVIRRL